MSDHKHILTLDLLRGYFLTVIFVNHLYRFPNLFTLFTGEGKLWISAAEGFFIISGLLVGYIYGHKILNNTRAVFTKLWRRAGQLYLYSIILTLFFTTLGHYLPPDTIKTGILTNISLPVLIYKTLTLQYIYGWADYLAYYAVFMIFAPIALYIAKKYHSFFVFVTSFIVWLFFRHLNGFFSWQFLFMSALVVGDNLTYIELKLKSLFRPLAIFTFIALAISVYFVFVINIQSPTLDFLFDKDSVAPGRYLLAWIVFATLYLFIRPHELSVNRITAGILKKFGQNSLFVYSLQSLFIFPINYLVPIQFTFIGNTLMTLTSILIIYSVTLLKKPK